MYGAGRSMQDMLESGKGLPLVIKINLRSNFNVVWNYVKPNFSHYAECYLLVHGSYDKQHRTQAYNNYCKTITTTLWLFLHVPQDMIEDIIVNYECYIYYELLLNRKNLVIMCSVFHNNYESRWHDP